MEAAIEQTTAITTTTVAAAGGGDDYRDDGGPKDITNVAKGKRTKRQRPQSPFLFTISSTIDDDMTYSPVGSSGFPAGGTTTEDEDTAESLILLSKGHSLDMSTSSRKNKEDYDGAFKFTSKKYIQSPANGVAGVFVYECKTCSRTFPSFQALGGHRASHKKPKNNEDVRKPPPYTLVPYNQPPPPTPQQQQQQFPSRNTHYPYASSLSLQLNNPVSSIGNVMKPSSKLHECSICGTEFNSGQALGGHMRRHRVAGGGNTNGRSYNNPNATMSMIPFSQVTTAEVYDRKSMNDSLSLSLDLNLPAPRETTAAAAEDDHNRKRSFVFTPAGENVKKQPPAVHLSPTPALVDCQY